MTAILPELAHTVDELQRRAVFLHAMAEAADCLFEDMPSRTASAHGNGLNAVLAALVKQSSDLAADLDKVETAIRTAAKGAGK